MVTGGVHVVHSSSSSQDVNEIVAAIKTAIDKRYFFMFVKIIIMLWLLMSLGLFEGYL